MRNPVSVLTRPAITAKAPVAVGPRHKQYSSTGVLWAPTTAAKQLDQARSNGLVYSLSHRLASDVARQEFCICQTTDGRGKTLEPPNIIDQHAFLDLWERPNEMMTPTGRAFREICGLWLELLGEATILVVSAFNNRGGQPIELWPVRPDRLVPVPDPYNWLAGWIYTDEQGEQTPLLPDQVLQLKYPDPVDPYRGLSPLRAAMNDVMSVQAAGEWQANFFENAAIPGGILTTEAQMTSDEFLEWANRWREQHQGPQNAGRINLMDNGGKFIPQQMSLVDMQLQELIVGGGNRIREAWGVSKTMLGQTEDVNRATAEAAEYVYGRYTLADRADLWLEAGNELLRRFPTAGARNGRRARMTVQLVNDLAAEDTITAATERDSLISAADAYVRWGADPADVAEAFNLPVLEFEEPEPVPPALMPGQPALPEGEDVAADPAEGDNAETDDDD